MSQATALTRHATSESTALYNQAIERISRNNHHKAIDVLIEALRISPGHPQYLSHLGLCIAVVDENFDRAIQYCRRAVRSLPTDPMTFVNLGRVYRLMGDNGAAYDVLHYGWNRHRTNPAIAAELTRLGIRRPPFLAFLPRGHWCNRYLGRLRASLERKLVGARQS